MSPDQSNGEVPAPKRKLRQWSCLFVCVALIATAVAHRSILVAVASGLVVDQRPTSACTHIAVWGGDKRFDVAADLIREDPSRKILHLGSSYSRLEEHGVLPPVVERDRQQLQSRGVPEQAIELRGARVNNMWEMVAELDRWLGEHPEAAVVVLSDRFGSRRLRDQLDDVLSPEDADRVSLWALTDRRYNEGDWWHTRRGVKQFVNTSLDLVATWWYGPQHASQDLPRWDPDAYEKLLASRQ